MKKAVKYETSLAGLAEIRTRIYDTRQKITEIENQALTADEIQASVNKTVDLWAARVDHGWIGINLANSRHVDANMLTAACAGEEDKITCLLAWLHGDELKAKLLASALPFAAENGMTANQRDGKARELEAEQHALEIAEEQIVSGLESRGVEVFRRPDCDPAIVLLSADAE